MANKSDCLVCFKGVSPDAAFLKCAECSNLYHIGKCSGVAKKAHKDMSVGALSAWICNTCKVNRQRLSGETSEDVSSASKEAIGGSGVQGLDALTAQITEVNAKLMTVLNRMEKIEKALDEKVNGMETALAALNAQYEEIFKNSQNQGKLIEELAKKTTHLEALIVERDAQILSLKTAVDNAEQYSRRKNIEIHGVKEYENENLVTVVTDLATKLQLPPPTSQSIETAHRLRAREGRTAPILVRFTERSTRDMWIKKRVSLKSEGIYVNENLTRTLKNLFWNTKKTAREKNYKFVWVRNGKIFVKEKDGSPVIRIENENDLKKIR
ncbi:unnamed protein product [Ixodes persulcatus]